MALNDLREASFVRLIISTLAVLESNDIEKQIQANRIYRYRATMGKDISEGGNVWLALNL